MLKISRSCFRNGSSRHLHSGLLRTEPVWTRYPAYARERWENRTLLDIFSKEFASSLPEYQKFAIECGLFLVNGNIATADTVIRYGDLILHTHHKHEPPIPNIPVRIVHEDKEREFIVVDKPGGIVVHGAGRFLIQTLKNSLKQMGYSNIFNLNRLDRLTSGIMLLPISEDSARRLGRLFHKENPNIHKEYLARCIGHFPINEIECTQPLLTADLGMGLTIVHPSGKHALTRFKLLRYDAATDTSLVLCTPITGRTHQIRVHLQYLGHPIANDPMYATTEIWGPNLGKDGLSVVPRPFTSLATPETQWITLSGDHKILVRSPVGLSQDVIDVLSRIWERKRTEEDWSHWQDAVTGPMRPHDVIDIVQYRERKEKRRSSEATFTNPTIESKPDPCPILSSSPSTSTSNSRHCPECYAPLCADPDPEDLYIFLHAWRHTSELGAFETEMPHWSNEEWRSNRRTV